MNGTSGQPVGFSAFSTFSRFPACCISFQTPRASFRMLLSKGSEPSREVVLNQVLRPKAQRLQHSSGVAVLRSLGIHGAVSPLSLACSIVVDIRGRHKPSQSDRKYWSELPCSKETSYAKLRSHLLRRIPRWCRAVLKMLMQAPSPVSLSISVRDRACRCLCCCFA